MFEKRAPIILVVEDSATQREALRYLLEEEGFTVLSAADGKRGLAAARANAVDLVVSDILMPEMDGYELCRELRKDEALSQLPVILLTSLTDPRDVIRGLESGASNFIRKPYATPYLLARVRNVLATAEVRRTAGTQMELNIRFRGKEYSLSQERVQLLDVLLSTYDDALYQLTESAVGSVNGARVLVVQESPAQMERIRFVLEESGCSVVSATRADEALAVIAQGGVQIVIADVETSDMDGYALCKAIRRTGACREVPIIMLTTLTDPQVVIAGLEAGVTNFVRKPFEDGYLAARVQNLLAGQGSRASGAPAPGIDIVFGGQQYTITADRMQMLDLLLSSYDSAVEQNAELLLARDELRTLNEQLEARVAERTEALLSEVEERKRAERLAEQSARQWRETFDAAGDAIWVLDDEGRIRRTNKAAERIFRAPVEEILGKFCCEVVHGATEPTAGCPHVRARKSRCRETAHVQYGDRWLEIIVDPIFDAAGSQTGAVHVTSDVTDRKRAEAARAELEEQLRASQKMEAIGSLAGGVAHDFNNLLSVILSYTAFALDAIPAGDSTRDDLLEVKHAADRAVALTRQLLAFSRKQILQPVPLDLNQTVGGIEKMLRRILGEDIDLVQRLAPDLGLTMADPGQVEQVIMNLVVNARDAMPKGGKLTIETGNVHLDEEYAANHVGVTPGPFVQIAITDTGCGMDAPTRARLFEPFFTTKPKGKGTGLGLSMVYGIVNQSGGSIWVYSELGKGTTFKVFLPRKISARLAHRASPSGSACSVGTETILVVEDELAVRKLAERILAASGYTVLGATNGKQALEIGATHNGPIHLLLTDVVMPLMSGRACAEELAKIRSGIKVVYMSGYTDNAIVHHGTLDPGTHFIAKPFSAIDLTRKVREVLDDDVGGGDRKPL